MPAEPDCHTVTVTPEHLAIAEQLEAALIEWRETPDAARLRNALAAIAVRLH